MGLKRNNVAVAFCPLLIPSRLEIDPPQKVRPALVLVHERRFFLSGMIISLLDKTNETLSEEAMNGNSPMF